MTWRPPSHRPGDTAPFRGLRAGLIQALYLATLFTIPFFRWRQLGGIKLDWVLVAALGLLVGPYLLINKGFPKAFHSNLWPWFASFFTFNLVSSLLSPYPAAAFDGLRILMLDFLFISVNLILVTRNGFFKWVPGVVAAAVSLNALLAVLGYFFGVQAFLMGTRGIGGTIGANNAALMGNFVLPLLAHWFFHSRSTKGSLAAASLFLLNVLGIVATESRGGFLVMLLVLLLVVTAHKDRLQPRYVGLVAAAFGILLLAATFLIPEQYFERQKTITRGTHADVSTQRRAAYLDVAWKAFLDRPLLGWGTNTFSTIWVRSEASLRFEREARGAHNTYAEVLVGSGLPGLGLFIGLLIQALRNYGRAMALFRRAGDMAAHSLVHAYRISFVSVLFYFLFKSGIDHKMFLLGLPLAQLALTYAEETLPATDRIHGPATLSPSGGRRFPKDVNRPHGGPRWPLDHSNGFCLPQGTGGCDDR
jgi:O-antigen ligase